MKKTAIVSITSFLFLLVCSAVAYLLRFWQFDEGWWMLAIGVGILTVSGVIAAFAHKSVIINVGCFFISAAALGFCIRAWYLFRGFDNSFGLMSLVSIAAALYIWLYFFLSVIPVFAKHKKLFTAVYLLLSLAGYLVAVFTTKTTYVSTLGYYMLIEAAFIFAMFSEVKDIPDLVRKLTLSTYSIFGVAVFMAILVLLGILGGDGCDCDCDPGGCECLGDCCDVDLGARKKRKK